MTDYAQRIKELEAEKAEKLREYVQLLRKRKQVWKQPQMWYLLDLQDRINTVKCFSYLAELEEKQNG